MRRCDNCHNAEATHQWLPYTARHLDTVACETCHIPHLYAPALQSVDWTVLTAAAEPRREYRGVEGDPLAATSLVDGFQPALLFRQDGDGKTRLAPHNLVTAWYWVYGDPARPVRLQDLKSAWFEGEVVAPDVLAALDANGDGVLAETELVLDTAAKQAAIAARLTALGLPNPRIVGDVQPYTISHDVANGEWVTRECTACHSDASPLVQPFTLAAAGPTGVTPALLSSGGTSLHGELTTAADGTLYYRGGSREARPLHLRPIQGLLGRLVRHSGLCGRPAGRGCARRTALPQLAAPAQALRRSSRKCTCTPCTSVSGTGCRPSPSWG